MTDYVLDPKPDHNSLGKAAFIIGVIALVLSIIPFIGFISWLLAPLAILFGLIALRKAPRSLAIAGLVTGGLAMAVCFWWVGVTKSVGEAMSKDTFNTSGQVTDLSNAPIMDTTIKGLWKEIEDNKVAAGQKYGGHRLRFANERIDEFTGDATNPGINFVGKSEQYISHLVQASFGGSDGQKIATLKKGGKVSFVCENIKENIGGGYSLANCVLK